MTPKPKTELTRQEKTLLLYLETRCVDYGGKVDTQHMNAEDMATAKQWDAEGFVEFGRVASEDITPNGSHWCRLSQYAFDCAHVERQARYERLWNRRTWKTTAEKKGGYVKTV